jgi:hypothetical protein
MLRVPNFAPKGPNKTAQGNALGERATPWGDGQPSGAGGSGNAAPGEGGTDVLSQNTEQLPDA